MQIELKDVSFIYSPKSPFETTALKDINLTILAGEFTSLIGHTGSGKSTLIQLLNGLMLPTSGKVFLDGKEIRSYKLLRDVRRKVGIVFQYPEDQFFEDTVYNEISFALKNLGLPNNMVENRVKGALEQVGFLPEDFFKRSPFSLSGGEKRRLAIATMLALDPEVLILDEPGVGLDPGNKKRIFRLIKNLHKKGLSIVLVSHDMDMVSALSDKVIVMNKGEIYLNDIPSNIFIKHRDTLRKIGLDIPSFVSLFLKIQKACCPDIKIDIFDIENAKNEIKKVFYHG